MQILFYYLLFNLAFFGDIANDPAHEAWQGRSAARQFDCERISQAKAHEQYPGTVPAPHPRAATLYEIDAMVCERFLVEDGRRSAQKEAILQSLHADIDELVAVASAPKTIAINADPNGVRKSVRFKVDAFYPDLVMTQKIANAARVALVERGHQVSDATWQLTAGDVEVFRSMHMRDALPLACKRAYQLKSLADDEVFVALALLHEKESQLHVGTCQRGVFRWLR